MSFADADDGGIFRSDDGGENWQRTNDDRGWRQRAWYYTHIYADTLSPDTVYVLNTSFGKSTDGAGPRGVSQVGSRPFPGCPIAGRLHAPGGHGDASHPHGSRPPS